MTSLPATPALPADAIALHIGVHKTGTTALQAALADARPELTEHRVLYPGRKPAHHSAALAVLGKQWGWRDNGGKVRKLSNWTNLVREASDWPDRVIVSSEHLCEANDEQALTIVHALPADRVQVVVTLRSLGRLLPSSWQQYLKYGMRLTYDEWLADIFDDARTEKYSPSFWKRNDHGALARRWADAVGPERVTFVVLEGVDHSAIFRSFAQMLALPEELLVSRMSLTSNRSMTAPESELLRRLNLALRPGVSWNDYETLVRYGVVRNVVEQREPGPGEPKLHTPDWALDEAARRGAAHVEQIRESGVRVVGDLDALAGRAPSTPFVDSAALDELPMSAAVDAIAGLVRTAAEQRKQRPLREDTRAVARRWRRAAVSKVKRAR